MRKLRHATAGALLGLGLALALPVASASAAVPYVVSPGDTLWGIAATDGLSVTGLAAYNGISPNTPLTVGQTIQIPPQSVAGSFSASTASSTSSSTSSTTVGDGDGDADDTTATSTTTTTSSASAPASGLAPIYCPCGTVYLRSDAAAAWNSMRQAALSEYGVDIYPAGALSAYRTYAQQDYLYRAFLNGTGAPADPPGTSSHELGTAVDVATPEMRRIVDALGPTYGWGKIHGPTEWWHVDYLG